MAGIALAILNRFVNALFAECFDQILMARVAEVGAFLAQVRSSANRDAVDHDLLGAAGQKFITHRTMRVMAARAIPLGGGCMYEFFRQIERRAVVTTFAELFFGRIQEIVLGGEVRHVAGPAILGSRRMRHFHFRAIDNFRVALDTEFGTIIANEVVAITIMGHVTGGTVLSHIGDMLRRHSG